MAKLVDSLSNSQSSHQQSYNTPSISDSGFLPAAAEAVVATQCCTGLHCSPSPCMRPMCRVACGPTPAASAAVKTAALPAHSQQAAGPCSAIAPCQRARTSYALKPLSYTPCPSWSLQDSTAAAACIRDPIRYADPPVLPFLRALVFQRSSTRRCVLHDRIRWLHDQRVRAGSNGTCRTLYVADRRPTGGAAVGGTVMLAGRPMLGMSSGTPRARGRRYASVAHGSVAPLCQVARESHRLP